MSHDDGKCPDCNGDWSTHTLCVNDLGELYGDCERNPDDGIDPYMKLYWDHALLKEQIEKIRSGNTEEIDRLKREHGTELDGQKQQLQQLRTELQSANARVRSVDAIVKSETARVQSVLEEAHKAALDTRLKALEQAHETVLQGRQTVLDELQNRYDSLTTLLRATEDNVGARDNRIAELDANLTAQRLGFDTERNALESRYRELDDRFTIEVNSRVQAEDARSTAESAKDKAERHARLALSEEEMAKSELKCVAAELKELKSMLAQLGGADSIRMLKVIQWYEHMHGPIPQDVEMQILAGLEVVPSTESAVSEVLSASADDAVVSQLDDSTNEGSVVSDSQLASSTEPVAEAQIENEANTGNGEVGATTDPVIELSLHSSRIVGSVDDIIAELDAQSNSDGAQAPMQCESPEGCTNGATKVATLKFPDGTELEVPACNACAAHPAPFLPALYGNGIQLDEDELRDLFINIDPDDNILTSSTHNQPAQEASHHA
ncbi:MAG: hypothetical protein WC866_05355 [Patescibacteria group bacterium]|jgi:hypothetical protein